MMGESINLALTPFVDDLSTTAEAETPGELTSISTAGNNIVKAELLMKNVHLNNFKT